MRVRQAATTISLFAIAAGIGVLAAPAAHAATRTTDCSTASVETITLAVGETLVVTPTGSCTQVGASSINVGVTTFGPTGTEAVVPLNTYQPMAAGDSIIYSADNLACGASTLDSGFAGDGVFVSGTAITEYEIVASGPCASADSAGPPDVIQQFAIAGSASCDESAPRALNWGGSGSGGWGRSWAQWVNDGSGGTVCTRTLHYDSSTAVWAIAS